MNYELGHKRLIAAGTILALGAIGSTGCGASKEEPVSIGECRGPISEPVDSPKDTYRGLIREHTEIVGDPSGDDMNNLYDSIALAYHQDPLGELPEETKILAGQITVREPGVILGEDVELYKTCVFRNNK